VDVGITDCVINDHNPILRWHSPHSKRTFSGLTLMLLGKRKVNSLDCAAFPPAPASVGAAEVARDGDGLGRAVQAIEFARVVDTRRRACGGDGGRRDQPKRAVTSAVSE